MTEQTVTTVVTSESSKCSGRSDNIHNNYITVSRDGSDSIDSSKKSVTSDNCDSGDSSDVVILLTVT